MVQRREERIRVKSDTLLSVCTDTRSDTWVDVPIALLHSLVAECKKEAGAS